MDEDRRRRIKHARIKFAIIIGCTCIISFTFVCLILNVILGIFNREFSLPLAIIVWLLMFIYNNTHHRK